MAFCHVVKMWCIGLFAFAKTPKANGCNGLELTLKWSSVTHSLWTSVSSGAPHQEHTGDNLTSLALVVLGFICTYAGSFLTHNSHLVQWRFRNKYWHSHENIWLLSMITTNGCFLLCTRHNYRYNKCKVEAHKQALESIQKYHRGINWNNVGVTRPFILAWFHLHIFCGHVFITLGPNIWSVLYT